MATLLIVKSLAVRFDSHAFGRSLLLVVFRNGRKGRKPSWPKRRRRDGCVMKPRAVEVDPLAPVSSAGASLSAASGSTGSMPTASVRKSLPCPIRSPSTRSLLVACRFRSARAEKIENPLGHGVADGIDTRSSALSRAIPNADCTSEGFVACRFGIDGVDADSLGQKKPSLPDSIAKYSITPCCLSLSIRKGRKDRKPSRPRRRRRDGGTMKPRAGEVDPLAPVSSAGASLPAGQGSTGSTPTPCPPRRRGDAPPLRRGYGRLYSHLTTRYSHGPIGRCRTYSFTRDRSGSAIAPARVSNRVGCLRLPMNNTRYSGLPGVRACTS